MKKVTLYTILVLTFLMLIGCRKKDIELTTDDVKSSTVVIKKDGTVQTATVEEFTKEYYNISELDNFITNHINEFNVAAGKDAVTKKELEVVDNNAFLILNYASVDDYAEFNDIVAANVPVSTLAAQSAELDLPDAYLSAKDGSYVNPETALKNEKYRVLIIKENADFQFEGDVKFFSNAILVDESQVQTGTEGVSFIIYKPW